MNELGQAFIARSRYHLKDDYLPKIERCLSLVSDQQIWWRANEQSNSIGNLLLHLSGNARQWIVSGLGGSADHRLRDTEFDERSLISKQDLLGRLKDTLAEVDTVLAEFDPAKLLDSYRIQNYDVTALEAIFHVVEHFSMHTGQIILMSKMFAEVDLEFYDFSGSEPVLAWQREED